MISKNDKRRQYAKMFTEVFNSGDPKTVLNFLETYCTKDCQVLQRSVDKDNIFIPKYMEIHGISAICDLWSNMFITIPDCLFVMLETKLRIRNNPSSDKSSRESSSIVSSFSFTGTKIYTMKMENAIFNPTNTINNGNYFSTNASMNSLFPTSSTISIPSTVTSNTGVSSNTYGYSDTFFSLPQENNHHMTTTIPPSTSYLGSSPELVNSLLSNYSSNSSAGNKRKKKSDGMESYESGGEPPLKSVALAPSHQNNSSMTPASTFNASNNELIDRYNIFLHPPRRFSTLAGTPYGGSGSNYSRSASRAASKALAAAAAMASSSSSSNNMTNYQGEPNKLGDYYSINSDTKVKGAKFIDTEGHLNFLGTFTMYLDENNKINKFEFIYSHMD